MYSTTGVAGPSVGVGVTATLAELGGHVGKGAFGLGAKVGLYLDTGASVGVNTYLKLLGTGIGFGEKGAEACILGNCILVG